MNDEEVCAAALQYVRKISGFNKPSKANEVAFYAAVDEIAAGSSRLLASLETNARPSTSRSLTTILTAIRRWFLAVYSGITTTRC